MQMDYSSYKYLDYLKRPLDDQQKKVCCTTQNSVVAAGAGSGKTQVLATRFAWLLMEDENLSASSILTLTFTKKAAAEMYQRIYETLDFFANAPEEIIPSKQRKNAQKALDEFSSVHIQTLDSYCGSIVKQAANRYGIRPDFSTGSTDSDRNIKNLALPFVLKNLSQPGIQYFTDSTKVQDFADNFISQIITEHTSLATKKNYFTDCLNIQKKEIISAWNNSLVSDKDSLQNVILNINDVIYETRMDPSLKETDFEDVKKFEPVIEKLQLIDFESYRISEEQFDSQYSETLQIMNTLLEKMEALNTYNTKKRKTALAVIKTAINEALKKLNYVKTIHAFVKDFPYLQNLFQLLNEFLEEVNAQKRNSGALTFNDVTEMALKILIEQKDIRNQEKAAFSKIMIDEFQDNNGKNRDLLFLLSEAPDEFTVIPEDEKNPDALHQALKTKIVKDKLFFVGDEKQSIYKFRGAEVNVFNELKTDLQEINGPSSYLHMIYNYRSSQELLTSFNKIFGSFEIQDNSYEKSKAPSVFSNDSQEKFEALYTTDAITHSVDRKTHALKNPIKLTKENVNSHFALFPYNSNNYDKTKLLEVSDQIGLYIAKKIKTIYESGESYSSIAILDKSRTNRHYITRWLERFNIPYSLDAQTELFSDAPVNDIYNFLRLCVYPSDVNSLAAFLSSPFAGLNEQSIEIILASLIPTGEYNSVIVPFNEISEEKIINELGKDSVETQRYLAAKKLYTEQKPLVLSRKITDTLNCLWYECGYRYETMLNRTVSLFEEQYDFIFELARASEASGKTASWFVDQLALQKDKEKSFYANDNDLNAKDTTYPIEKNDCVQIMTIHKSKGLQFNHVFVLGCLGAEKSEREEDFFYDSETGVSLHSPSRISNYFFLKQKEIANQKNIAEFRRVIYVALTRAIKDFYVVGPYTFTKERQHNISEYQLLDPLVEHYYPDFIKSDYTLNFNENAPFDIERIPAVTKTEAFSGISKKLSPVEEHSQKISAGEKLYSDETKKIITTPQIKENRFSPSSLEESVEISKEASEHPDSFPQIDDLLNRINAKKTVFQFNDFGTLVHFYLEQTINGIDFNLIRKAAYSFTGKIQDEGQQNELFEICETLCKNFLSSDYGKLSLEAKTADRFIKTEYAFKLFDNNAIVTGSIDLAFENSDGTYTIVDYKTDHEIHPEKYEGQQSYYRKALSMLVKIPENRINCVLYYLRYNQIEKLFI